MDAPKPGKSGTITRKRGASRLASFSRTYARTGTAVHKYDREPAEILALYRDRPGESSVIDPVMIDSVNGDRTDFRRTRRLRAGDDFHHMRSDQQNYIRAGESQSDRSFLSYIRTSQNTLIAPLPFSSAWNNIS